MQKRKRISAVKWNNLGTILYRQGKIKESLEAYGKSLELDPKQYDVHFNMAVSLKIQGKIDKASAHFKEAARLNPKHLESQAGLVQCLSVLGKLKEAIFICNKILPKHHDSFLIHQEIASLYTRIGRHQDAIKHYKLVLKFRLDERVLGNLGVAYAVNGDLINAEKCLRKAIKLNPQMPHFFFNLGEVLERRGKIAEALHSFEHTIRIAPDFAEAYNHIFILKRETCDWERISEIEKKLDETGFEVPFTSILRDADVKRNYIVAKSWSENLEKRIGPTRFYFELEPHEFSGKKRLRIGYFSKEFRDHPVGQQIASLFSYHDKNHFETFAFSYGENDKSIYRKMIENGIDHFSDVSNLTSKETASFIYKNNIDILLDLTGNTAGGRLETCAMRPSPIQITWMGFLGTSGASFFDYLIADNIVVPVEHQRFYSEHLIYMPKSFLVNNDKVVTSNKKFTRASFGLPKNGVVFACFQQPRKIEPVIWQAWMRILKRVPESIIWIWERHPEVSKNLRREAKKAGIDPKRIIFYKKLPMDENLVRIALADIALDTFIYGGAATTSATLWAGVPVITMCGQHFISRVGASIATAAHVPELIAKNLKEYEQKAVYFAKNPNALNKVKNKLQHTALLKNLYDTPGFVRNLEEAYFKIWQIYKKGDKPQHIILR